MSVVLKSGPTEWVGIGKREEESRKAHSLGRGPEVLKHLYLPTPLTPTFE